MGGDGGEASEGLLASKRKSERLMVCRNQDLDNFLLPKGYTLAEGAGGSDVIYIKGSA
jgi:hypothetical protein